LLYVPLSQQPIPWATTLLIRGDAITIADAVRRTASAFGFDRRMVTSRSGVLATEIAAARYPRRLALTVTLAAAVLCVLIAIAGLYGAFVEVSLERAREVALRLAIGAPVRRVVLTLARAAVWLAVGAAAAGVVAGNA